ncbi:conserved hypothetical protein [Limnospira maxima CS-328]|uniref:DUF2752 domain-containing protein n=1 Tax=Limnospira maxima CS-328 TaxID=513049 RepID=B5W3K2_LIMMA|nr:DUF2752 domain-containing protein [Limnospira maxima]EDZ93891.1 conserved hypothetical protein [Limnospira maxima CS-328]MDC0837883.1 DUF2752 domain-containing protein [Limnoraphis robusta]
MVGKTLKSPVLLSRQQRQKRMFSLAIALIPIIGSIGFNLGIHLEFLRCPLMRYVGVPCPAWGLTRSLMATVRGDLNQAIAYHLFCPLIFLGFVIAIIHLILEIIKNRKLDIFYIHWLTNPQVQILIFLILLGYHSVRLQHLWQIGKLYPSFLNSPIGRLLLS